MALAFVKNQNPLGKSDVQYTALTNAVQAVLNADPRPVVPFADVIAALKAVLPAGWAAADITDGLIKQVAQDLNLPHRSL